MLLSDTNIRLLEALISPLKPLEICAYLDNNFIVFEKNSATIHMGAVSGFILVFFSLNIFYSINTNDIQHTYIVNIQMIRTKA